MDRFYYIEITKLNDLLYHVKYGTCLEGKGRQDFSTNSIEYAITTALKDCANNEILFIGFNEWAPLVER